jgi:hypothetical protein
MVHDVLFQRRGEPPALGERVPRALPDDRHRTTNLAHISDVKCCGSRVSEENLDVLTEFQQEGVIAEQNERTIECPPFRGRFHEFVVLLQVLVENLDNGTIFVAKVAKDLAMHAEHGLLDPLEVRRQLANQIDEVRVPVKHPII